MVFIRNALFLIMLSALEFLPAHAARTLVDPSNESKPNPQQHIGLVDPHTSDDMQHQQVGLVKPHKSTDGQQQKVDLVKPGASANMPEKPVELARPQASTDTQQKQADLIKPNTLADAQSKIEANYQFTHVKQVNYEIRYIAPNAEDVFILWALDNWQVPDKSLWPPGATAKLQFPYCKMSKDEEVFTITLKLPKGVILDYCFNVLDPSKGLDIWDTNGEVHRDYHSRIVPNGVAVIMAQDPNQPHEEKSSTAKSSPQPVRFILPIAAVLLLVFVGIMLRRRIPSKAT